MFRSSLYPHAMSDPYLATNSFEFDLSRIGDAADIVLNAAGGRKVWLFFGEPGAGKTTLITTLIEKMGGDPRLVNSPTFAIMNRYETKVGPVNHFDLYRTKSKLELLDLGLVEFLESGHYCFIEWPERLEDLKPEQCVEVFLEHRSAEMRMVRVQ